MVAAEVAIPIESRKMVKPRILSKVSAKNNIIIPAAANAVRLTVSTSFLGSLFLKEAKVTQSVAEAVQNLDALMNAQGGQSSARTAIITAARADLMELITL